MFHDTPHNYYYNVKYTVLLYIDTNYRYFSFKYDITKRQWSETFVYIKTCNDDYISMHVAKLQAAIILILDYDDPSVLTSTDILDSTNDSTRYTR